MIMPLADEVRTVGHMRITFHRFPDHSSAYSVIERDDGVVYRMKEFTRAGTELPHDLRHFVVERELGITNGIWGGIAAGMVYTSMDHVRQAAGALGGAVRPADARTAATAHAGRVAREPG